VDGLSFYRLFAQVNALITNFTSTSQAAYWHVWAFITAVSQALMEQRFKLLQKEIANSMAKNVAATKQWIQAQVLLFQDGNTIQLNSDFTFGYPDA
jgi:hypothetical protein